jgi:hypothetical protein
MTQLMLTPDQAAQLSDSDSSLLVCRPDGQVVGVLAKTGATVDLRSAFSADEIAAADRELRETTDRRATQQVFDRLVTPGGRQ